MFGFLFVKPGTVFCSDFILFSKGDLLHPLTVPIIQLPSICEDKILISRFHICS